MAIIIAGQGSTFAAALQRFRFTLETLPSWYTREIAANMLTEFEHRVEKATEGFSFAEPGSKRSCDVQLEITTALWFLLTHRGTSSSLKVRALRLLGHRHALFMGPELTACVIKAIAGSNERLISPAIQAYEHHFKGRRHFLRMLLFEVRQLRGKLWPCIFEEVVSRLSTDNALSKHHLGCFKFDHYSRSSPRVGSGSPKYLGRPSADGWLLWMLADPRVTIRSKALARRLKNCVTQQPEESNLGAVMLARTALQGYQTEYRLPAVSKLLRKNATLWGSRWQRSAIIDSLAILGQRDYAPSVLSCMLESPYDPVIQASAARAAICFNTAPVENAELLCRIMDCRSKPLSVFSRWMGGRALRDLSRMSKLTSEQQDARQMLSGKRLL